MTTKLRRLTILLAGTSALAACATTAPRALPQPELQAVVAAPASEPVPVATLVEQVSIPHQMFRLANGLTVIVHEDRKAPVVGVSMWYNVGSKDEPAGKTGFAHLFEHLMFNGSESLPGDFFTYLQQIGATDYNGTTWFDRTNYFQTVPTGALEGPAEQQVGVGDVVPLSPDGMQGVRILALDLPRSMMWGTLPDETLLKAATDGTLMQKLSEFRRAQEAARRRDPPGSGRGR